MNSLLSEKPNSLSVFSELPVDGWKRKERRFDIFLDNQHGI